MIDVLEILKKIKPRVMEWIAAWVTVWSRQTTHYEILQDSQGAIVTDSNGDILYVEVL